MQGFSSFPSSRRRSEQIERSLGELDAMIAAHPEDVGLEALRHHWEGLAARARAEEEADERSRQRAAAEQAEEGDARRTVEIPRAKLPPMAEPNATDETDDGDRPTDEQGTSAAST
jgi:hypothetical protein